MVICNKEVDTSRNVIFNIVRIIQKYDIIDHPRTASNSDLTSAAPENPARPATSALLPEASSAQRASRLPSTTALPTEMSTAATWFLVEVGGSRYALGFSAAWCGTEAIRFDARADRRVYVLCESGCTAARTPVGDAIRMCCRSASEEG